MMNGYRIILSLLAAVFFFTANAKAAPAAFQLPVLGLLASAVSTPLPYVPGISDSTTTRNPAQRSAEAAPTATAPLPVDMRLLVLSASGQEPSFAALKFFLDYVGIPYYAVVLTQQPLPQLEDATKGFFQGIILATGNLAICDSNGCRTALSADGWAKLDAYAAKYGVRTVAYYTYPEPRYGFNWPTSCMSTTTNAPVYANYLPEAANIFPYLRRTSPAKIAESYMCVADPYALTRETSTPVMAVNGKAVGMLHRKADGREYLSFTFDNNPYLTHSLMHSYGIFQWVTKGIHLGYRKVYLTPQSDDLFLPNDLFDSTKAACIPVGFTTDPTFDPANQCPTLRIDGADFDELTRWQDDVRRNPQTANFRVTLAFNGYGTTQEGNAPQNDTLLASVLRNRSKYYWVNHTWDHENLDCYDPVPNSSVCRPATYAESLAEIDKNVTLATQLRLPLDRTSMVTPAISGLNNAEFLRAAVTRGIRYLVSDTSRPEGNPPSVNTGIVNQVNSRIFMIPRRATNIFYNVTSAYTGAVGSEPDEYNYFYGPNGIFRIGGPGGQPFFNTVQSYQDIVNRESDNLLTYMWRYEQYPSMFHQSNHWRYNGRNSLFVDVIDATLRKFREASNLPVLSLSQSTIGRLLQERISYNNSGVTATLTPGVGIVLKTSRAAKIPVTGVCVGQCESYGGQFISYISLGANGARTIALGGGMASRGDDDDRDDN